MPARSRFQAPRFKMGLLRVSAVNDLLHNWRNLAPLAGLALLAATAFFLWMRQKQDDTDDLERQRRAYVNRIGRIVEGRVLEIVDHGKTSVAGGALQGQKTLSGGLLRQHDSLPRGSRKLLYYSYAISGVSYETAQDITGLDERIHLSRVAAGQIASVKYDPSNPSNSILLADDWSGLH